MASDILEWAGNQKEEITQDDYDDKAKEGYWDKSNGHVKFPRILFKFRMVETANKANRLAQNGEPGNGIDAWRRFVFAFDPSWRRKPRRY